MAYLSDIEIAQACRMRKITEIARLAGIEDQYLEQYGNYKAKVDPASSRSLRTVPTAS